ncbi:MAG: translation initiation factor IF-1 [Kiritimatiellales bacterium]|nr:translation initiation factor IF-1 [Kiritimatiellales bacterium]
MENKERILLDATLNSVISQHAFGAELHNGHQLVAFFGRVDKGSIQLNIGGEVKVEMSPYDMSKGRILVNQGQEK